MSRICMLDWETLDTQATAKVIAVGAVTFDLADRDEPQKEFYTRIGTSGQFDRTESSDTVAWWDSQSGDAKLHSYDDHGRETLPKLDQVVLDLRNFITATSAEYIMGNGNMFDCNIFRDICESLSVPYPVPFWADLDLRTAKLMSKGEKLPWPDDLTPHHALHDAKYQTLCLQSWWKELHDEN